MYRRVVVLVSWPNQRAIMLKATPCNMCMAVVCQMQSGEMCRRVVFIVVS